VKYGQGWRPPPVDWSSTRGRILFAASTLLGWANRQAEGAAPGAGRRFPVRALLVDPESLVEIRTAAQSRLGDLESAAIR
jgi:hypothetical protein